MSTPRVTVVTTVYDRVACLARCLRAQTHSQYENYEQVVVSDAPGAEVEQQIDALVQQAGPRVRYLRQPRRANDWGMTPAWAGVQAARGEFVCFLSDDNAYLPEHLAPLVAMLDNEPALGFAYSSCLYDGRFTLNNATPVGSKIDLGQPLFRRQVLLDTFPTGLPYREFAWDWRMIDGVMQRGARWRHLNRATFLFRLAKYPAQMRALA
jgi:glycosyltransferase involved in cell wall biosynthesis